MNASIRNRNIDIRRTKKMLAWLLILCICTGNMATEMPVHADTGFQEHASICETDTLEAGVKQITTAEELAAIRNDLGGSYVLVNDIDLSDYENWTPIGRTLNSAFKGIFDGQGHKITGLRISKEYSSGTLTGVYYAVGLFGVCSGANIRNIAIEGGSVSVSLTGGYQYEGAMDATHSLFAGALVGYAQQETVIENCSSSVAVSASVSGEGSSPTYAGGIVGCLAKSDMQYCYYIGKAEAQNTGSLQGNSANAGGLAGKAEADAKIIRSYNSGSVKALTGDFGKAYAGGLCGATAYVFLENNYNEGAVHAQSGKGGWFGGENVYAGGIAGYLEGTINYIYNSGTVTAHEEDSLGIGSGKAYAGGICGESAGNAVISNSAVLKKEVTATAGGGRSVQYRISSGGQKSNNLTISQMTDGSNNDADLTVGEALMKQADTYEEKLGWDFDLVWEMVEGKSFPVLKKVKKPEENDGNLPCGEFVTWKIEGDTLLISGYGAMYDWDSPVDVPWKSVLYAIKKVVVEDSITTIGKNAFGACLNLESVFLGELMTAIGDYAFSGCTGLTDIEILEKVTDIGEHAFSGCSQVTIFGYEYSYAESYAKEHHIPFEICPDSAFDRKIYHASYIYDFYQGTDGGMNAYFKGNTPSSLLHSEDLYNTVQVWDTFQGILGAVDDPSSILDKPFEKKDLYEGIVFSLFEAATETGTFEGAETIKTTNELLSVIIENMNAIYGIKVGEDYKISSLTTEQKETIRSVSQDYFKTKGIVKTAGVISNITKAVNYIGDMQEFCEYQSSCFAIMEMSESYKAVLQDMYDACPAQNVDLEAALRECISVMRMSVEELSLKMGGHVVFGIVGKDIARRGIQELWKEVKEKLCTQNPYVALLWVAYKTSNFFCDTVLNTSDIAERTMKMAAMMDVRALVNAAYKKEADGFANSRVKDTAEIYLAAIDVNFKYLEEDCNAAYQFTEAVSDALWAKIQAIFKKNNAEEVRKQIRSIQQDYNLEYESTKRSWVYGLEEEYPRKYAKYEYLLDESWNRIKKKYSIACPVDVYIYDGEGKLAASVVNQVPYCKENAPFTVAVIDDKKEIWFYDDTGEYMIVYVGTDTGMMDINIEEFDDGNICRQVKYWDVPLANTTEYTSIDVMKSDNNTYDLNEKGTGNYLNPDMDTADKYSSKYTVAVENGVLLSDDNVATSAELAFKDRASVYAYVPDGYVFEHWASDAETNIFEDSTSLNTAIRVPDSNVKISAVLSKKQVKVEKITLSLSEQGIEAGKALSLYANVEPKNADNMEIKWTSDNEAVAIVDSNGLVTAVGEGKATITASSTDGSNISASCVISVTKKSEGGDSTTPTEPGTPTNPDTPTEPGTPTPPDTPTNPGTPTNPNVPTTPGTPTNPSTPTNPGTPTNPSQPDDSSLETTLLYYIVKFDANGGKNLSRKTMTLLNDDNLGILPKTTRKNYTFKGWYTQKTGGKKVTKNTVLNAATTLYAQWTKVTKPAQVLSTSLEVSKKGQLTVSVKKVKGATGYEIAYSTNKKFPASATKKVRMTALKKTLKNLKSGKTYYVKIRAYKTDSSGNRVYGAYSVVKNISVKQG